MPGAAPPPDVRPAIPTHDQRLRVFVSSTLEELAAERRAVRDVVARLRLTPVMFELGARAHPPRDLYRAYLDQSDVFVGIYGERYGWVAPGMDVSGLEDEYELSAGRPRLLYVRRSAPAPRAAADRADQPDAGGERRLHDAVRRAPSSSPTWWPTTWPCCSPSGSPPPPSAPPGLAAGWLPTPDAPLVDRARRAAPW